MSFQTFTSYTYLSIGYAALSTWFFDMAQHGESALRHTHWLIAAIICILGSASIVLLLNRYIDKLYSVRLGVVTGLVFAAIVLWYDHSKMINDLKSAYILVPILLIPIVLAVVIREKKSNK